MSAINFPQLHNNTGYLATKSQIDVTYYLILATELVVPFVGIFIASLYRKSIWENLNFGGRLYSYDIHVLRSPESRHPLAKIMNIICYRHRPLPLEILRLCLDISILLYLLGYVRLVIMIVTWCACDFALCLHILSLVYVRHTQLSQKAVRLATYIATVYTLLLGFPLGFVAKIMLASWMQSQGGFSNVVVPMYIAAVGAFVFTLCYLLPTLCWNASANGCRGSIGRLQLIVLLMCYCAMWMVLYYNISVCSSLPGLRNLLDQTQQALDAERCMQYFVSWTTAFLPLSIILVLTTVSLMFAVLGKRLLYRFLPEVISLWSCALVFISLLYQADGGTEHILILPMVTVLLSIVITVFINAILMMDIISGLRAPVINLEDLTDDDPSLDEEELHKRKKLREDHLKEFAAHGGRTSITGTLMNHFKKRMSSERHCAICLEDFVQDSGSSPDPDTETLESGKERGKAGPSALGIVRKCGHYFHFDCIFDWLEANNSNTCPLCRNVIDFSKDDNKKSDIKIVDYEQVKSALEVKTGTKSSLNTMSRLVGDKPDKKSRTALSKSLYPRNAKPDPTEALGPFVQGDRSGTYRVHTRPVSKHCGVCNKKFPQMKAKDIIVGYIRTCGHYFHWDCLDRFVINNECCPTCHRKTFRGLSYVNEALEDETEGQKRPSQRRSGAKPGSAQPPSGRTASRNRPPSNESKDDHPHRGNSRKAAHDRPTVRDKSHRKRLDSDSRRNQERSTILPDQTRGQSASTSRDRDRGHQRPTPGPSAGQGRQFKKNSKAHTVSSGQVTGGDIVFAFLSDIQRGAHRRNWRQPFTTVHVPSSNSSLT